MNYQREIVSVEASSGVVKVKFTPSSPLLTATQHTLIAEINDPALTERAARLTAWQVDIPIVFNGPTIDRLGTIAAIDGYQNQELEAAVNTELSAILAVLTEYDQLSLLDELNNP